LGKIEAFEKHISDGTVETFTILPTLGARSAGFSPAGSQLLNLEYLRLVDVDIEGHMEDAPIPFPYLLRHWTENRRDAGSRFGARRLEERDSQPQVVRLER
jgi:hypothetical protein